jgi:hypothetical protein
MYGYAFSGIVNTKMLVTMDRTMITQNQTAWMECFSLCFFVLACVFYAFWFLFDTVWLLFCYCSA